MDPEFLYNWFAVGLSPGQGHSVSGWAADKEMRGKPVPPEAIIDCIRILERKNATTTALAK